MGLNNRDSKGWEKRKIFTFHLEVTREEKRGERGKREKREGKGEEAKPSSTRGKGLISHCYGCMWFYAMGSMYV